MGKNTIKIKSMRERGAGRKKVSLFKSQQLKKMAGATSQRPS